MTGQEPLPLGVHAWQLQCGEVSVDRVLDMREVDAFDRGHLPGATNLSYNRFQDEVLALLVASERVLVVDPGGARAAEMATWLRRRGHDAAYLEGGMSAWMGDLEHTRPRTKTSKETT